MLQVVMIAGSFCCIVVAAALRQQRYIEGIHIVFILI